MYLLDTNVISEFRKAGTGKIDRHVKAWAKTVSNSSLFLSVVSVLELETGILLMERRDQRQAMVLREWMEGHVLLAFEDRVLPIDAEIARRCAALHVPNRCSDRDAMIAATALVHGMTVVTRNVRGFTRTRVPVFNPWEA
jgi:predicted nucleic acid-binding protein